MVEYRSAGNSGDPCSVEIEFLNLFYFSEFNEFKFEN